MRALAVLGTVLMSFVSGVSLSTCVSASGLGMRPGRTPTMTDADGAIWASTWLPPWPTIRTPAPAMTP
jgi:hypothetical protein